MLSAPSSKRQHQSRPDQNPAGHHSAAHPSQEHSQRGARGEESPGAACSAGDNGQRRQLPPDIRPETGGQRVENGVLQEILQAWRHVVVITPIIVTVWRADDGQTCTAAAPSQRGGGWFAIPQAEMWVTPWVTLPPTSMFHFQCSRTQFQPRLWNQVPRWTQVTRKIAGRGGFRNGMQKNRLIKRERPKNKNIVGRKAPCR